MVLDSNIGQFDFNRSKVRLNGWVLDKFNLVDTMRHLDFKRFYWSLLYANDTHTYSELRELLIEYLTED